MQRLYSDFWSSVILKGKRVAQFWPRRAHERLRRIHFGAHVPIYGNKPKLCLYDVRKQAFHPDYQSRHFPGK